MIIFLGLFTSAFDSGNPQQVCLTNNINNFSVIFKCDSKLAWVIGCCIHNMATEWETLPLLRKVKQEKQKVGSFNESSAILGKLTAFIWSAWPLEAFIHLHTHVYTGGSDYLAKCNLLIRSGHQSHIRGSFFCSKMLRRVQDPTNQSLTHWLTALVPDLSVSIRFYQDATAI